MERSTDWIRMWRELIEAHEQSWQRRVAETGPDVWVTRARSFHAGTVRRWQTSDSSRDLIAATLAAQPGATALDIGAGPGMWAAFMARRARAVTAVEPSGAMIEVMREHLASERVENVTIVQGAWPQVEVEPHDVSLCSQAMYGMTDLPAFVRSMVRVTRRTCFLLMRAPTADGVMADAARHLWGHPYDSANFQVAYNVLLQMGICANVLMENTGLWEPWASPSLDAALTDIKERFGLGASTEHDAFLADLLRRRLVPSEGRYLWPRGLRSALVYWDVERERESERPGT